MSKRTWSITGVAGLLLLLFATSWFSSSRKPKGERVYLHTVEREVIQRLVKARGEVDPRVKVELSAHVIAKIEKLHVEEGDAVAAGEPVVELEKEAFTAARNRAAAAVQIQRSRLQQAEIEVEDANLKLRRAQRLFGEGVLSQGDLDAAQLAAQAAAANREQGRSALLQATAALEKAEDDRDKTTIYTPITGRVIELNAEEGEVVVSGTMNNPASIIGVIADLSELLAVVDVDETEIVHIDVGQAARLNVDANREVDYAGRVVEIGNAGFQRPNQPDVTFFEVKLLFTNADEALKAGMSVRAEIQTAEVDGALVVPVQAVVLRASAAAGDGGDGEEVQTVLVAVDSLVEERQVETGISNITMVQIAEGIEEGERVITGPARALRDLDAGDRVRERESEDEEDQDS